MIAETSPKTAARGSEASLPHDSAPRIPQPTSVAETGLELSLLADLMLKQIHVSGRPTTRQLSQQLEIAFQVTDELLWFLRQEQAVEVVGTSGVSEQAYQYALTDRGRKAVDDAMRRNSYVGPAPVPFQLYVEVLQNQSAHDIRIDRETFSTALGHLSLSRQVLATLGPAFNSGRSVLIYGGSGNGKTAITTAIRNMLPGEVLIPFAVEIHGQIVRVFDPRIHERIPRRVPTDEERRQEAAPPPQGIERRRDRRWALCKRPIVAVGGELTLQDLELRYSPQSQFYIAPLQWKANSGVLIIDDFGRQMIQPQELLNRWIVPMEQGMDHLTLHTGDTIELPFDVLLIFSSNIPPGDLGDEAFFRRIRHKVAIPNPSPEQYLEIMRNVAEERGIDYHDEAARALITKHYERTGREMKSCHPRDIIDLLTDIMEFYGERPALLTDWLDLACESYFVKVRDDPEEE